MAPSIFLIAFPVLSFVMLLLVGNKIGRALSSIIGVMGIAISALLAVYLFSQSLSHPPERQLLWAILPKTASSLPALDFALLVDPLSLIMALVVSFVSFWIALYSTEYMAKEEGLVRFFAVVNLFVAFMLLLVLADNLFLLFIGWEGVGICSYLLIGYYHREKAAEMAAMKAFLVTRVGDIFLLFAMFAAVSLFHTTNMVEITTQAQMLYPEGSFMVTVIALCLLGGAVGKSAQIPLQIWLPDAMWGPTPVSALIHAATMVTAGVYLLARMSPLLSLSLNAQIIVFAVGAITLTIGGLAALVQTDLKRVLAYSTMSQIGYMFLALGVLAPKAAMFHLTTHAFFKALLFLCAGAIGHALHTYDMGKMGGLYKKVPGISILFFIGCVSLVGLPFISAGFFSKEWILGQALANPEVGTLAYSIGVFGVFLTALYTTRMVMLVFFGEVKTKPHGHMRMNMGIPLVVLAAFSVGIGWLQAPKEIAHITWFSSYLMPSLPDIIPPHHGDIITLLLPNLLSLLGFAVALVLYKGSRTRDRANVLVTILQDGGGLNRLCMAFLVTPYVALSRALRIDLVEQSLESIQQGFKKIVLALGTLHHKSLSHHISFLVFAALALASVMVLS
jgi:NADH-quinone oxidoreductase subunit L